MRIATILVSGNEGGWEQKAFGITADGCYNVEFRGDHMFCCGGEDAEDDGADRSCSTMGYWP